MFGPLREGLTIATISPDFSRRGFFVFHDFIISHIVLFKDDFLLS